MRNTKEGNKPIMGIGQNNHEHNPAYSNPHALTDWVKKHGVSDGIALANSIATTKTGKSNS